MGRLTRGVLGRRDILTGAAAGSAALLGGRAAQAVRSTPGRAVDLVPLGSTGLKLSRLGFGTGTMSGEPLRALPRAEAVKLMHYAFERGITFIDTADMYHTHDIVREALRGQPREKFFVMTKMPGVPADPKRELDRYRRELGIDVIDLLLVHCARTPNWDDEHKRVTDVILEAQQKSIVRARGVSCHGLPALRRSVTSEFPQVHLVRYNPIGTAMDGDWQPDLDKPGDVAEVTRSLRQIRAKGRGTLGMKIFGEGRFKTPELRDRSIKFAVRSGLIDAMTIGYLRTSEVDEAIARVESALAAPAGT